MLKGVNKQVVEVVDVDNEYFERAILFIKPEKQEKGEAALRECAHRYLGSIRYRPRRLRGWRRWVIRAMLLACAVGAGVMLALWVIK